MKTLDFINETSNKLDNLSKEIKTAEKTIEDYPYDSLEFEKEANSIDRYHAEFKQIKQFFEEQSGNINLSDSKEVILLKIELLSSKLSIFSASLIIKQLNDHQLLTEKIESLSTALPIFKQNLTETSSITTEQETQFEAYQRKFHELELNLLEIQALQIGSNYSIESKQLSSCKQLIKDISDILKDKNTSNTINNNNQAPADDTVENTLLDQIYHKLKLIKSASKNTYLIQDKIAKSLPAKFSASVSMLQAYGILIDSLEEKTKEIITEFYLLIKKFNFHEEATNNLSPLLQTAISDFNEAAKAVQNRIKELSENYSIIYNEHMKNNQVAIFHEKLLATLKEVRHFSEISSPQTSDKQGHQNHFDKLYILDLQYKQCARKASKSEKINSKIKLHLLEIRDILNRKINDFNQLNYAFLCYHSKNHNVLLRKFLEEFLTNDIEFLIKLFPTEKNLVSYKQDIEKALSSAQGILSHIETGNMVTVTEIAALNALKKFKPQNFIVDINANKIKKTDASFSLYDLIYTIASTKKLIMPSNDNSDVSIFTTFFRKLSKSNITEENNTFSSMQKRMNEL